MASALDMKPMANLFRSPYYACSKIDAHSGTVVSFSDCLLQLTARHLFGFATPLPSIYLPPLRLGFGGQKHFRKTSTSHDIQHDLRHRAFPGGPVRLRRRLSWGVGFSTAPLRNEVGTTCGEQGVSSKEVLPSPKPLRSSKSWPSQHFDCSCMDRSCPLHARLDVLLLLGEIQDTQWQQ